MYLGVVHMKYKGITEWWVAGTGFEELQRKSPNWLSRGSRALSEGILLYAYKKDSYIFFLLHFMCFGTYLQNILRCEKDFSHYTFPYICIHVDIFF